ncbi:hypothetical protein ACFQ2C_12790 [Sphingobacterium daejeonense]|uniref:Lipid A core - O-antigen ligase and related enzymes n=2 Tax=Sphingobacterium daejeonense TaxID=371142 RepID=A0ABW3RP59_9SPHI
MKLKVWIIIILFFYIYPIFLSFLPIPLDRLLQIIGFLVFLFTPKFRKYILQSPSFHKILIGAVGISILTFIAQAFNYSEQDFYFLRQVTNIFFNFFSAYLIIFLLYKYHPDQVFHKLTQYLIIVYVLQAVFSFVLFLNPAIFDIYISLLKQDNNENFMDRLNVIEKRLIGVGSGFFLGVLKYGVVFFMLIIFPYIFSLKSKYLYIFSLVLVTIAGVMTGRTFFVAILMGIVLFSLIDWKNSFKFIFKILPLSLIIGFGIITISDFLIEGDRLENISNYVLEIFINYEETGTLSTSSSDATKDMYIFPTNDKTWLLGDGRMMMNDGSYYMGSDVGYVRLIFYFGIISTVLYFLIQGSYFSILIGLTKDKSLKLYFLFLFIWILVLNLKGISNLDQFVILFLIGLIINNALSCQNNTYDRVVR